jgi:hypothetical protein
VVSSQVAEEALLSVFVTRPEVFDSVEFGGESEVERFTLDESAKPQTNSGRLSRLKRRS